MDVDVTVSGLTSRASSEVSRSPQMSDDMDFDMDTNIQEESAQLQDITFGLEQILSPCTQERTHNPQPIYLSAPEVCISYTPRSEIVPAPSQSGVSPVP
jgi:hypothetical protein